MRSDAMGHWDSSSLKYTGNTAKIIFLNQTGKLYKFCNDIHN